MKNKEYDVVIVGGGLSGLCAAYTLSNYGVKSCLVEKSEHLGGGNQSFQDEGGNLFDMGYHALDDMRSPLTSRLFSHVLKQEVHRVPLQRGIVLDQHLLPYNAPLSQWPNDLADKIRLSDSHSLGEHLSVDAIASAYGPDYAAYARDCILASYPSELASQALGRPLEQSLGLVYPWFFPKMDSLEPRSDTEWNAYHDRMRQQQQHILYPKQGGFNAFIDALAAAVDNNYCDIYTNCGDVQFDFGAHTQCKGVRTPTENFTARHYFWCAPFFPLAKSFGMDLPKGKGQTLALGSFAFEAEVSDLYHEILVGSLDYPANRISFPGRIRQEKNNLIQVEYLFPADQSFDEADCVARWLACFEELGLSGGQRPKHQRVDLMPRGMVTGETLDSITARYRQAFHEHESNIFLPFVNAGPENINRLVPAVIVNTSDYIINHWGE